MSAFSLFSIRLGCCDRLLDLARDADALTGSNHVSIAASERFRPLLIGLYDGSRFLLPRLGGPLEKAAGWQHDFVSCFMAKLPQI
jgi:hypothetical protein